MLHMFLQLEMYTKISSKKDYHKFSNKRYKQFIYEGLESYWSVGEAKMYHQVFIVAQMCLECSLVYVCF